MKFDIYQDNAGEWRWRLISTNGRIIADSGEGYVHRHQCLEMVENIRRDAHLADVAVNGVVVDTQS